MVVSPTLNEMVRAAQRLEELKPSGWSLARMVLWLSTPHLDFSTTPAEALRLEPERVVAAFERAIQPPSHG